MEYNIEINEQQREVLMQALTYYLSSGVDKTTQAIINQIIIKLEII
jgi:hypothetical protein